MNSCAGFRHPHGKRLEYIGFPARHRGQLCSAKSPDIRAVGREVGVRYVLEGSVRRAGGRVRIIRQLIEAATGGHVWADRFEGDLADIFDVQDRITESVAGAIEPNLQRAEIARAAANPTESLDAWAVMSRLAKTAAIGGSPIIAALWANSVMGSRRMAR
jgi:hypothetical protein